MIFWNPGFTQSQWAARVSEDLGTFEKNYLYPSVLRALNINQSNEFNQLIEDISYIRVLRIDSAFMVKNQAVISEMGSALKVESFENIALWQESDGGTKTLFVKENKERIQGFLAVIKDVDSLLIIEIVGDLNVKNLSALMNVDYGNFNEFVGLDLGL